MIQERLKVCKPDLVFKKYHQNSVVRGIENWLRYIPRNQLFILNFERLKSNADIQRDTVNRILQFLNQPPLNDTFTFVIPQSNNRTHHCGGDCNLRGNPIHYIYIYIYAAKIAPGIPQVSCHDVRALRAQLDLVNKNLIEFINDNNKRPKSEPEFLPFREEISCHE